MNTISKSVHDGLTDTQIAQRDRQFDLYNGPNPEAVALIETLQKNYGPCPAITPQKATNCIEEDIPEYRINQTYIDLAERERESGAHKQRWRSRSRRGMSELV